MRSISPTIGEAYSPAEGLCGAPPQDVGPYRKSQGLSASSPGEYGQPTTRKLLGMRVIQGPFGEKDFKLFFPNGPRFLQSARPSPPGVHVLPEPPLDAPAGLEASRDAELPLRLREVLRREPRTRPQWRLPPASLLMMRYTWWYLACVGTFICDSLEKLNSTLNRLLDGF